MPERQNNKEELKRYITDVTGTEVLNRTIEATDRFTKSHFSFK